MINIVMVEPEIPSNTGNISRTCAVTGCKLHLVKPLGFNTDDKMLKRAGLDYWDKLDIEYHESLEEYLKKYGNCRTYYATTKAKNIYSDIKYFKNIENDNLSNNNITEDIYILFGKETKGLPEWLLKENLKNTIRIPMKKTLRSLNLANSVNIIIYEILRQNNFKGLEGESKYF